MRYGMEVEEVRAAYEAGLSRLEVKAIQLDIARVDVIAVIATEDIQGVAQVICNFNENADVMHFENCDVLAERFYQQVTELADKGCVAALAYRDLLTFQTAELRSLYINASKTERLDIQKNLIRRNSQAGVTRLGIFNDFRDARATKIADRLNERKKTNGLGVDDNYKHILKSIYSTDKYAKRGLKDITETGHDTIRRWVEKPHEGTERPSTSAKTDKTFSGMKAGQVIEFMDLNDCKIEVYRSVKRD